MTAPACVFWSAGVYFGCRELWLMGASALGSAERYRLRQSQKTQQSAAAESSALGPVRDGPRFAGAIGGESAGNPATHRRRIYPASPPVSERRSRCPKKTRKTWFGLFSARR